MLIPKLFHRCWVGPKPIHDDFQRYWLGWKQLHPDWDFLTWTDDALAGLGLVNKESFDSFDIPAAKADIAMHEILYRFGGVWLCCDMEAFRNIEPLIGGLTAFAGRQEPSTILGAIMGMTPGHYIGQRLVDGIPESVRVHRGPDLPQIAGPVYLTRTLAAALGVPAEQLGTHSDFTVIDREFVYPYLWVEEYLGRDAYPTAYCAHHWAGSWTK